MLGLLFLLGSNQVWAHGESVRGVGGVGLETMGGEVGEGMSISVHYDMRKYNLFSEQQLLNFQAQGEDVHQHATEQTALVSLTMGLSERWDLSVQVGYGRFSDFQDNSDAFAKANPGTISKTDVSSGLTDLLLLTRYQFYKNVELDQHVALVGGIKLPTGNIRSKVNNGLPGKQPELVGTHNQIGSGSTDFILGVAYTGHFLDIIGVSSDFLARINTEGAKSFRSGNQIQADLALAYKPHARVVPSFEVNYIATQIDIEEDELKKNSGVTSVFLTPGLTVKVFDNQTIFVNYSFPVIQILPGIQNKEDYRVSAGYAFSF